MQIGETFVAKFKNIAETKIGIEATTIDGMKRQIEEYFFGYKSVKENISVLKQ